MEKPVMLKREELIQGIVDCINKANLHPCIVESVVESILNELHNVSQQQYDKEKEEYEKYLAENSDKKEN